VLAVLLRAAFHQILLATRILCTHAFHLETRMFCAEKPLTTGFYTTEGSAAVVATTLTATIVSTMLWLLLEIASAHSLGERDACA